jgi:hypothetical protein
MALAHRTIGAWWRDAVKISSVWPVFVTPGIRK